MPPAIRCSSLTKTYNGKPPVEAVRGIDFEVNVGECYGVLGPNGAGKTTTIEILEGLLKATSGEAEVLGMNWAKDAIAIRERIGVSLQETQLSERLSVGETLDLFRSFYATGITPDQAIARVSLQEKKKSWIKTLSGGQKQRLAVATALVGDPELIVLDEPTTGLHFHDVRQLLEVLASLRESGNTIIVIEHNLDVIKTADWIIDLGPEGGNRGGEILVCGPPETVAADPASDTGKYLKKLLSD